MPAPCFARAPIALATWLCLSVTAQAQTAPQTVEVIGVSPLPGLGVPRDRVPGNVQTAKGADIERSQASDLAAFLNRRLGSVQINELQNNPFQPDVNYRGFTASPLLGTAQGLSVYVDGVRLNQPFGDVVSWDLIPKSAIASIALMPGSNPLFGLNTLGGALSVQTKDGLKNPGSAVQLQAGSHGRVALEFESGGSRADGVNWFVTGNRFQDRGWRVNSPSDVSQLYGKLGGRLGDTALTLSASMADNRLGGNGLQEQRLLARNGSGVYSQPDTTLNRAGLLNLAASHTLSSGLTLSGNAYWRRIHTATVNGDVNEGSLDQSTYQPNANERAALTAAGYSGFPTAGESAANTPFPKWRCIANALRQDEPGEKCNGLINQSRTAQVNSGFSVQVDGQSGAHQWLAGLALDSSRVHFTQGSELGYLNPDHSVTGVGAFGDGVSGGNVDGVPYDTRVDLSARTRSSSLFASDVVALGPRTHLTASARYNRSTVQSRDAITPGGGSGSLDGDQRFSRLNPALGLTHAYGNGLTAYAGANQGSRAPSAIELGCADPANPCKLPNAMAGDPPLKQVVTTTLEAGLRGQRHGLSWNLGLFRSDNRDDILFVADNASGFGYFKNFGKTRRQGLEAGMQTTLAGGAELGANLTLLDATYRSAEQLNAAGNSSNNQARAGLPGVDGQIAIRAGDRMPLLPRQILKLFAQLPLGGGISLGGDLSAVGSSLARGNENNAHQPDGTYYLGSGRSAGYTVFNLNADWQLRPGLRTFAQVSNLFDRRYSTGAQLGANAFDANGHFVARPFAANANGDRPVVHSTFLAPGAPRSVTVGVRVSFL